MQARRPAVRVSLSTALFLLTSLASGNAQEMPSRRGPLSTTSVEASSHRVRITFPVDTSGTWVWRGRPVGEPIYGHVWQALVDGMDGLVSIGVWVYPSDSAITFSSLDEVVEAGRSSLCLPGMVQTCGQVPVARSVERNRVVVTLEDPVVISRLFGTRPAWVRVNRQSVDDVPSWESDSVLVRYVAPQVPMPDSATWAEAAKGRRQYQASITSISRNIRGVGWSEELWLAVGDSLKLELEETHCHYDSCVEMHGQVGDSGWSVADPSIVQIRAAPDSTRFAYGRRAGKTTIRVRGLHGPSDTMPSKNPPERSLTRKMVVGRSVVRVSIVTRPDTVEVGEPVTFRARAFDRGGHPIPDVPIEMVVDIGHPLGLMATQPYPAEFRKTGERLVVAQFRELADTLRVMVVEKKTR
jgi:hypothetical protein